jgi:hypothetical protein
LYYLYLRMSYNFEIAQISYDDDEGYQRTICKLFFMEFETGFDNEMIDRTLDKIYLKTKAQPLLQNMYMKAASFMLSENPEIGLAVLFAYDNLPLFHPVLVEFNKSGFIDETSPAYVNLHKKLFS